MVLLVVALAVAPRAQGAEFEVGSGYLSASVRDIVEGYGWSLVWAADEDRIIDHPFTVSNGSLQEGLTNLLAIYRGQLVADLYQANQVVVVDAAPPRVRIVLPGEQAGNEPANEQTVVDPASSGAASRVAVAEPAERPGSAVEATLVARTDSEPSAMPGVELAELPNEAISVD